MVHSRNKDCIRFLGARVDAEASAVLPSQRGQIKQSLSRLGWPAEDFAGYVDGQAHQISLQQKDWKIQARTRASQPKAFWHGGSRLVCASPAGQEKQLSGQRQWHMQKPQPLILVTNTGAVASSGEMSCSSAPH